MKNLSTLFMALFIVMTASAQNSQRNHEDSFVENALGLNMKMVYIEGGTFTMGATSEQDVSEDSDEKPTHSVTVSSFYMGQTEVTQAQWKAVMGTTIRQQRDKADPSYSLSGEGDNYPTHLPGGKLKGKRMCPLKRAPLFSSNLSWPRVIRPSNVGEKLEI